MNRSTSKFGFISLITFTRISDFRVVFRKLKIDLGASFGFYSVDCFDRVVFFFLTQGPVSVNFN